MSSLGYEQPVRHAADDVEDEKDVKSALFKEYVQALGGTETSAAPNREAF